MKLPKVLLLGPDRGAISGVSTHLNLLLGSALARRFDIEHFQVGSEGREEGALRRLSRLVTSPFALAAAIARSGASIVHLNPSLSAKAFWRDFAHLLAAKLCGVRIVYQIHGGSLDAFCPGPLARRLVAAALRLPDVVVVLARCELEQLRALLPRQNLALIPNAIDCAPFLRARDPAAARAPLRLFHIGRLIRSKGAFDAIEALALLKGRGIEPRLVIAGGGPDEAALRAAVEAHGLAAQVSFAGSVFGEEKTRLVCEADVLLLPTYHAEGLPYALLEGMAAGQVPVVTRVAAIPDVVAEGVHGLFVPPRDPAAIAQAIAVLDADRERLARMSAACRERAASAYSIERLADDFSRLYAVLAGRATPRMAA